MMNIFHIFFERGIIRKIEKTNRFKHKVLRVINKPCKNWVTIHPKKSYNVSLPNNLWLPFVYQPQSEKSNLLIILFLVYTCLVKL